MSPREPDAAPDAADDPRLREIVLRLADGAPVDWPAAGAGDDTLSDTLERLHDIERLAEAHRDAHPPSPAHAAPAFTWGPLRVLDKLGEGGFSEVWRAWDPSLAREVALKLQRTPVASGVPRWLREAQRLARVRHAHVIHVYGADVHDARPGLWTELVRGRTLEQDVRERGPLGAAEATLVGLDLCAALAAVHAAGIVHGDVKTRNVMREGEPGARIAGAGRIVLMDFGTAAEVDRPGATSGGTPLFSAPERLAGAPASVAADLYALGVVLYRIVTAAFPVEAGSLEELRRRHEAGDVAPLRARRPDLPPAFVQVVERALAREPERRFRDAAEMERALAATLGSRSTIEVRTPAARIATAAAAGALLVALAWAGVRWVPEWTRPRFHVKPVGAAVATRVMQVLKGDETSGLFGFSVASPGDLDGDGIPELLVGAPGEASAAGRVHLYRGRPDGTFVPWRTFTGHGDLGYRVAALGDVNRDGIPDFALGAALDGRSGQNAGAVEVYFGDRAQGGVPAITWYGRRPQGELGYSVAGAGDVNGDGDPDIIAGAPLDPVAGGASGAAFVWFGGPRLHAQPDLTLAPGAIGGQFGFAVAGIGDMNGDGFADVAVGANVDRKSGAGTGRVAVYFGGRAMGDKPSLELYGPRADTWFGCAIAGAGDLDEDGFDDLAVGAERADGLEPYAGTVTLYRGGQHPTTTPSKTLSGPHSGSRFGHALARGPVTGGGRNDLVVGAYGETDMGPVAGAAYVFRGTRRLERDAQFALTGTDEHGNLGTSVTAMPGFVGNYAAVVAGAPYSSSDESGAVWVYATSRHAFTRPHAGERWAPGTRVSVAWVGAERATLAWAPASGGPWRTLARDLGGREQNTFTLTVPAEARGPIRLRLEPTRTDLRDHTLSEVVSITPR